jgi:hypothetical protein
MGNISVRSDGKNGSFNYSTSWTPTAADLAKNNLRAFDASLARLWITGRGKSASSTLPVSSTNGSTLHMTWSSSGVDIGWLRDCGNCTFVDGTYAIRISYVGLDGIQTTKLIESGTVSVSGTIGCKDCEDGGGGEEPTEEPAEGQSDEYGPVSTGDDLPNFASLPAEPCLPASFVAPAPAVPTPCSGGSGGTSSTPGFN